MFRQACGQGLNLRKAFVQCSEESLSPLDTALGVFELGSQGLLVSIRMLLHLTLAVAGELLDQLKGHGRGCRLGCRECGEKPITDVADE